MLVSLLLSTQREVQGSRFCENVSPSFAFMTKQRIIPKHLIAKCMIKYSQKQMCEFKRFELKLSLNTTFFVSTSEQVMVAEGAGKPQ